MKAELSDERPDNREQFSVRVGLKDDGPAKNPRKKTTESHNWVVATSNIFYVHPGSSGKMDPI